MITQRYNLNLIPDKVPVIVNCSQYDANSRTIEMVIYDGSSLYSIPNGASATVRGTKQDNTGFEYNCTISGSVVTFDIKDQMTIFAGRVPCEVRLSTNGEIIGTCNFLLNVEETTLDPGITISESDLPLLEEAEQNAVRAEAAADEAVTTLASAVKSVNSITPDANGNITISAGFGIEITNNVISEDSDLLKVTATYSSSTQNYSFDKTFSEIKALIDAGLKPYVVWDGFVYDLAEYSSTSIAFRWEDNQSGRLNGVMELAISSSDVVSSDYYTSELTSGTGIKIENGVISNVFDSLESYTDLNTITYNYQGYVPYAVNAPSGYDSGMVAVFTRPNGLSGCQLYQTWNGSNLFFRNWYSSNNVKTWNNWRRAADCYEAGDTYTAKLNTTGYISSSTTACGFPIILDKPLSSNITTFTLNSLTGAIRGSAGYVDSTTNSTNLLTKYTCGLTKISNNQLMLGITSSTAMSNATNNSVVNLFSGTNLISITFS